MKRRKVVAEALAKHYSQKFNGHVWSDYDEIKRAYYIRGENLPACDELKAQYPNGWSLLDYIKPSIAQSLA